jgi:hypothetical protein
VVTWTDRDEHGDRVRVLIALGFLVCAWAATGLAWQATVVAESGLVADAPAPFFWDSQTKVRAGGGADRFELDDSTRMAGLSSWYHLAYIAGGQRLQVHDHNPATTTPPDADIAKSEGVSWHVATSILRRAGIDDGTESLPAWARPRTGNADGASAGLLFALADLDLRTPGALARGLRLAATGTIGSDGSVTAVRMVDAKLAAARLAGADAVFATDFPGTSGEVTAVRSHLGHPTRDRSIGDWLNTDGFRAAGRAAAGHRGSVALVRVDDVRQALAWICGRTGAPATCALADAAAATPLLAARPYIATRSAGERLDPTAAPSLNERRQA